MLPALLLITTSSPQIRPAVWLHDLDLKYMRQDWGEPQKNISVDRNPLSIGGVKFEKGIGTHASSEITVELGGQTHEFMAQVGVDDEVKERGTVTFEVWADGKKVADSGPMRGGQKAKQMLVSLAGVKEMRLIVGDGGDGIDYDHADWVNAAIVTRPDTTVKPAAKKPLDEPVIPIADVDINEPGFHGPRIVGCSPGKPFIYRVPCTREGGFMVVAFDLPKGLAINGQSGIISGTVKEPGIYGVKLLVGLGNGKMLLRPLTIVCGNDKLALTPPMGWNSWNIWGTHVDADKVRAAADAFEKSGLADFGYQYVNIDDAWEGKRDANGEIQTNEKFGDMEALAAYVHSKGLKLGIYSSPGPKTCAGYEGSWNHELQDAKTYAKWGIDYLKHDWCSYGGIAKSSSLVELKYPYHLMNDALKTVDRDIVLSLCQYGMGDVYKWGNQVGGHLWRTTGDITDTWGSMSGIGFQHSERSPYAGPGGWNDPDMLVVGYLGWGPSPRPTRLTKNEQVTHITLWAMLAAPLIIGCDLTQLDQFTKNLLMNHDVIEVDQDPLGKAATRIWKKGGHEVWTRPLWDGTTAVALFNRDPMGGTITVDWSLLKRNGKQPVRDLWMRKDLGAMSGLSYYVPTHGARLFKVGRPDPAKQDQFIGGSP